MTFLSGVLFQRSSDIRATAPLPAETIRVVSACERIVGGSPQCSELTPWALCCLLLGGVCGWAASQWCLGGVPRQAPAAVSAAPAAVRAASGASLALADAAAPADATGVQTFALDVNDSDLEQHVPRRRIREKTRP